MQFQHQGSLIFPLIPFKCCLVLWSFFRCISVVSSQSCFRCLSRVGHSAMHHPGGLGFAAHCALSELMTISPRRLIFGTIPRFCRCRRHISPTCCFWKVPYSLLISWSDLWRFSRFTRQSCSELERPVIPGYFMRVMLISSSNSRYQDC